MNKKTKGIVAGVAGGALLLGAGSTFALWSDTHDFRGGIIRAGSLSVTADDLEWFDVSPDVSHENAEAGTHIPNLNAFRIVPGDVLEGRTEVDAVLEGQNLQAQLSIDGEVLDQNSDWLVAEVEFGGQGESTEVDRSGGVPLVVTIEFPSDRESNMSDAADLGSLEVTLEQVRPIS